ncbi:NADase-type glycan-binding domain-containing protein [Leptospira yasudae]
MESKIRYIFLICIFGMIGLFSNPVSGQVETWQDCFSRKSNASLKKLNQLKHLDSVEGRFYEISATEPADGMDWQTSFMPHKSVSKSRPKNTKHNEWAQETCGLNAYRVQDNRESTIWCEGVPGVGIGEVVVGLADLEGKNFFYILPGYQGMKKYFESFSRPSEIVVHYLLPLEVGISQAGGKILGEVVYWGKQSVKLSAEPGYQKIEMQQHKEMLKHVKGLSRVGHPFVLVAIEIKSVIEGKENKEHTCIAEIGNSEDEAFYKKATLRD